jgi:hypothetical protein
MRLEHATVAVLCVTRNIFIAMEIVKTHSPIKSRRSSQKERSVDNLEQGNHQSTSDNIEKKPLKYIGGPVRRGG